MKHHFLKSLLISALLAVHLPVMADDIDLFVGAQPSATDAPNVLIIIDNTANWSTAFNAEMSALATVVGALPEDKFRLGLMFFTESGGGNSGNDGGYMRAAIRTLNSSTKTNFVNLVNSFDKNTDKSSGGKAGTTMEEAYRYFKGIAPYSGNNKAKTDYTGNTSGTAADKAVYALAGNALSSIGSDTYVSPLVTGCAKNFIIYISNSAAMDNNSDSAGTSSRLGSLGGSTAIIPISPSLPQDNKMDEWARFMKSDIGVTTFVIEPVKGSAQTAGWTANLKSVATVSEGEYVDLSADPSAAKLIDTLNGFFSKILSVNSVFASVSLPVSVNTQGTYLNQVYVGMFRPDENADPRWAGNLKQYRLGMLGGTLRLLDANTTPTGAINSATGFITECARSFWTPSTVDTYWAFRPKGVCLTVANSAGSEYPDGNIVDKGAQSYKLRSAATRTIKTCSPVFTSCNSAMALSDFNNANVSTADLGAASSTERDALITWQTGYDIDDENGNGITKGTTAATTENRPSLHGDVVHSRPIAINYGSDAAPQVVVFYGGNDGILRAVNGNRTTAIGTVPAGGEFWSFVAPESYANIKRLRDNQVKISFPGFTAGTPTPQPKPYGVDGAVSAYRDASKTWLYSTMRRGGRVVYSFNVTTPASPTLKWKIGCPLSIGDDAGCTAGLSALGQTWAMPRVLSAAGYSAGTKPMLIMGGGYDPCEDADPNTCTSSSKGNKIYVLDADLGTLLKTFDTDRGVVGDVTLALDSAGLALYGYAADLGGNVYRITMGTAAPAAWTITKIASLGCATAGTCAANRKFMFAPDVIDDNGTYILLIGSGDREKPVRSYSSALGVSNYFFMLTDKPTDSAWLTSEAGNCTSSVLCLNSLVSIPTSATPSKTDLAAKKGWYLGMSAGEQVVTSAITVFGVVTFSTHVPAVPETGVCGSLGKAYVYNISYSDASGVTGSEVRGQEISGGGLPPSPVAGMVTLDGTTTPIPFCIGCDPTSPLEGSPPVAPVGAAQPKSRVYWYIQK